MWVVANFLDENTVEVVPCCWMQGDYCYWPSIQSDKLKKAIERETVPDGSPTWLKCKARIIGRPYDNLLKAREKSVAALTKSDLDTTDLESSKREIKLNKRYNIDDSSSSSDAEVLSLLTPEKAVSSQKKFKKMLWTEKKKKEITLKSPLKEAPFFPPLRKSPRKTVVALASRGETIGGTIGKRSDSSLMNETISNYGATSGGAQTSSNKSPKSPNQSEYFESTIIRNQNVIKTYLRTMMEELSSLHSKMDTVMNKHPLGIVNTEESNLINQLPLTTVDELVAFDEVLKDKAKEAELVNFLARLGGSNVGDSCRRALRATLRDEVACEYSWAGQKGKNVFSSLNLKSSLFKAVLKQFPNIAKEKDIECIVKDWLRPSRNRLISKEKSARKRSNKDDAAPDEVPTVGKEGTN